MKASLKEKLAYKFDNYMSRGPGSIFFALLLVFLGGFILLGIIRLAVSPFLPDDVDPGLGIWRIFLQLTDPGNMAQDNDSFWYVKTFAIIAGMFGIIFFSAVIAFITTQLDLKLESLKKGKSRVIENGHVLILGWNYQVTEIIREIISANESEKDGCVVILSEKPKEEMDDFLNEQLPERKTTRIITRNGETGSLNSLYRVGAASAKSVIILPSCASGAEDSELAQSDAATLKSTLAVIASSKDDEIPDIVAQVYFSSNKEIIEKLAEGKVTIVDPEDMVAKIAVQTSRSTGLSAVYAGLIGFDGCEFYFTQADYEGIPFPDIHYHYRDGVAIGIKSANGSIDVNPPAGYILQKGDEIIMLAEDDSTIRFHKKPVFQPERIGYRESRIERKPEKILIIGWNEKGRTILSQYQDYILEGSVIHILPLLPDTSMIPVIQEARINSPNTIKMLELDAFSISALRSLNPASYSGIIILSSNRMEEELADAATINILLLLRQVINESDNQGKPQIITEVLNSGNLELISATGANDAIISTRMVSKVLAQIAAEPDILTVYEEIFQEDGSEIYLKPLNLYIDQIPETLRCGDLIEIAKSRNEICIGYRSNQDFHNVAANFGVQLNPPKDTVIKSSDLNALIVIAEDEL